MKIYYGQNYAPDAYLDLNAGDGIAYDTTVVNTEGLVGLIELHLGIHHDSEQQINRQVKWLGCMRKAIERIGNPFAESWQKNALGVSNQCLAWRDALRMALWRNDMAQPNAKFALIAEADKCYDSPSVADRLIGAAATIEGNPFRQEATIYVDETSKQALGGAVAHLLDKLEGAGVSVIYATDTVLAASGTNLAKVQAVLADDRADDTLRADDQSFEIWEFDSAADAYRYIALLADDEFDLYVASPNGRKLLDNTQKMLGQPTSGTKVPNSSPQIVQMFLLGMNLFEYPLNINNLLAWLQTPMHPIPSELRHKLVKAIVESGGYQNQSYDNALTEYLDGLPTDSERDKALHALKTYVIRPTQKVDVGALNTFNKALNTWATQMSMIDGMDEARRSQLVIVSTLCTALDTILADINDHEIPYRRLDAAISTLFTGTEFSMYQPEEGSRHAVDCGSIATAATSVIWTDCYNYEAEHSPYDFVNSTEREALTHAGCAFSSDEQYNRAAIRTLRRPVLGSRSKCVLVTAKKAAGTDTTKHPLLIRLTETMKQTLPAVIKHPRLGDMEHHPIESVDNLTGASIIEVDCQLPMPDHESYSSLDTLIQYPLDYVLERVAKINSYASTGLDELRTVKGNVAHKVIESLFVGDNATIAHNLEKENYAQTLRTVIEQSGAILLLPENDLERQRYKSELYECLKALHEIITDNDLEVVSQEQEINTIIGLREDAEADDIRGFIDMVLRRRNGSLVIFDFKWTTSRSYHENLLQDNLSLQLALYRRILHDATQQAVAATAYFTMPWHSLHTTSQTLQGANVHNITPKNTDDILQKAINGYRFRRKQLAHGQIEDGERHPLAELAYYASQEQGQLFDLRPDYDEKEYHAQNPYSNYTCFKNTLK